VNQQIKDELEISAQEIKLADAKRINGLRAVFGEVCSLSQLHIPSSRVVCLPCCFTQIILRLDFVDLP